LDCDHVVILSQVDSPLSTGFYGKVGRIVDLVRGATGQVILAHQTPEICSRAIQLWCKQHNAHPPRDLAAQLAKIRQQGYEVKSSYEVKGIVNITFPVLDDRGYAIAALTVPFLQRIGDSMTPARVRPILKEASMLLSRAIGGTGTALREKST
jgi:DNA-binding IclR family transcriptional regulator